MVKFSELKVADLRKELEERGADSSGLKAVLQDRLRQLMIEEGEDPETFEFESPELESKVFCNEQSNGRFSIGLILITNDVYHRNYTNNHLIAHTIITLKIYHEEMCQCAG
ncbi:unnamed protein product [Callosobruchus maculatus]|uniref:SAP domain-containing protein n=1 Tax=Callosobruchus maculatus TaxID=64391 RepID=A0A653BU91_CALMS|nr:unnamed protein product [Callosobruchus maculatus]